MSTQDYALIKTILAENGYSWTKPRENVFKVISTGPLAMAEVIKKARVDRVSVYRTVELFENLGIVHRINIGWKYKIELSDKFIAHHHHLTCLKCGKAIDIEDEKHINTFIDQITARFGFKPERHQFEIEGVCRECLTKQ